MQGPDGRGYIMQDFAPPPEYASSPERQSVVAAECGVMAGVAKIKVDQVETIVTEDEPEPEESSPSLS